MILGFDLGVSIIIYILALLAAGVVVTHLYFMSYQYMSRRKKINDAIEHSAANSASKKLLEQAQQESVRIISDAQKQANEIIKGGTKVASLSQQELSNRLESISDEYTAKLQSLSQGLSDQFDTSIKEEKAVVQSSTKGFEGRVIQEIKSIADELQTRFDKSQQDLLDHTSQLYKQVQTELDEYKTVRMKQIDGQAQELAKTLAKDYLRTNLTLRQHEQAVMELIDNAQNNTK